MRHRNHEPGGSYGCTGKGRRNLASDAGSDPGGTEVTCRIDWERRFDLMQQHSGEHLISGLIHEKIRL